MITIAVLTVGEAARRKVLWVLVVLAILAVAVTTWGADRLVALLREQGQSELEVKLVVSQVLIFIAFQFTFILAMTAAFLGSPAISADLESGIAQALLARPLRRSSYLLGRWLGLSTVVVAYAAGSALLALGAVGFVSDYTPPNLLVPVAYLAFQAIVLLSFSVLLSTRLSPIAGGAICVVAYGLAWMSGVLGDIGSALGATGVAAIGDIGRVLMPTDGLWRGVVYGLEPSAIIAGIGDQPVARANPFFASEPPSAAFLAWALTWVVVVLGLAIVQIRRREL
ncbi:MAG TPA: ABC transporter permease [Candidatus Acidoferrales bacterium]|jgi:ABC-type transport system involved in multi-copper enzyme maturation permease subunit|nr:ABC transporter permease [Candidatus Acidoferrales bacterium]